MSADPRLRQLEEKALRGVSWSLMSYVGTRLFGVATTLVLARLLAPSDFGLVAFAVLAIQFVLHFTGLGLGAAMIIRSDLDRHALGTVETMMVALGLLSTVLLLALSPLAANALGDRRAAGVLAALTIPVVFGGFTHFHAALLQRELAFATHAGCLIVQATILAAVSILLATFGAGVWSIVVGQIAATTAYTVALVVRSPFLVPLRFDAHVARDITRTGGGFVLQAGFSFVEQNVDYAIIGSSLGARPLGAYSLAYRLSELPYAGLAEPVAQVTFPGFARMRHRSEDITDAFLSVLRSVAVASCPFGLLLAAAADPFVRAVLGSTWLLMVGPLSVLGFWGAIRPVQGTIGWMLNSVGYAGHLGRAYALLVVGTLPLLILAASRSGVTAVAAVMLGNLAATLGIGIVLATRKVGVDPASLWAALRPVALAAAPTWLVARALAELSAAAPAVALVLSLVGGLSTYLGVLVLVDRRVLPDLARQVRHMWQPPSIERQAPTQDAP